MGLAEGDFWCGMSKIHLKPSHSRGSITPKSLKSQHLLHFRLFQLLHLLINGLFNLGRRGNIHVEKGAAGREGEGDKDELDPKSWLFPPAWASQEENSNRSQHVIGPGPALLLPWQFSCCWSCSEIEREFCFSPSREDLQHSQSSWSGNCSSQLFLGCKKTQNRHFLCCKQSPALDLLPLLQGSQTPLGFGNQIPPQPFPCQLWDTAIIRLFVPNSPGWNCHPWEQQEEFLGVGISQE